MSKYRDWVIAAVGIIALDFSVFFHLNSQPRLWTIVKIMVAAQVSVSSLLFLVTAEAATGEW